MGSERICAVSSDDDGGLGLVFRTRGASARSTSDLVLIKRRRHELFAFRSGGGGGGGSGGGKAVIVVPISL